MGLREPLVRGGGGRERERRGGRGEERRRGGEKGKGGEQRFERRGRKTGCILGETLNSLCEINSKFLPHFY